MRSFGASVLAALLSCSLWAGQLSAAQSAEDAAKDAVKEAVIVEGKATKAAQDEDKSCKKVEEKFEKDTGKKAAESETLDAKTSKEKAAKKALLEAQDKKDKAHRWQEKAAAAITAADDWVSKQKALDDAQTKLDAASKPGVNAATKTAAQNEKDKAEKDRDAAKTKYETARTAATKAEDQYQTLVAQRPDEPLYATEHMFFEAGVVGLSPYAIKSQREKDDQGNETADGMNGKKQFYLDKSGAADVKGYIQFRLRNRDAWNDARDENPTEDWCFFCTSLRVAPGERDQGQAGSQRAKAVFHLDYDVRVGTNFGSGSGTSGTAIAGAGDVELGIAVGLPLLRVFDREFSHSINVEFIEDLVTDRGVQDVHHREGFGIAWVMGIRNNPLRIPGMDYPDPLPERVYEIMLRPTVNLTESPNIVDGSPVTTGTAPDLDKKPQVKGDGKTLQADFKRRNGVGGVDFDLQIPVGTATYWHFGASVFGGGNVDPNPWSIRLGATVPIGQLVGLFTSGLGGSDTSN